MRTYLVTTIETVEHAFEIEVSDDVDEDKLREMFFTLQSTREPDDSISLEHEIQSVEEITPKKGD